MGSFAVRVLEWLKKGRPKVLNRPLQILYQLEIREDKSFKVNRIDESKNEQKCGLEPGNVEPRHWTPAGEKRQRCLNRESSTWGGCCVIAY